MPLFFVLTELLDRFFALFFSANNELIREGGAWIKTAETHPALG
jgi:hypothetical protein